MSPTTLREVGEALYGPLWQSALARDLGVSDRTMRRWAAGEFGIPDGAAHHMRLLMRERRAVLGRLLEEMATASP